MKPQREIRVENENTEENLSGAHRAGKDLSPLCALFSGLGVTLWFHEAFKKREYPIRS